MTTMHNMLNNKKISMLLFVLFIISHGHAEDYVRITSPKNGWSSDRIVKIQGETSINVPWLTIVYNGLPFLVPVSGGRFERKFVAFHGPNCVYVEIQTRDKTYSDSVTFYSDSPPLRMRMILIWDTDGTHIDLWITEPSGELCKWNHKQTESGGVLDIGTDYPGYGPQLYTHSGPPHGTYKIQVHYYSANNVPQTLATIYIVLDEGGENEVIKTYQVLLTKPGLMYNVDSLTIE
jgi:uncharacterized protein YfaP (DUF2135 family)